MRGGRRQRAVPATVASVRPATLEEWERAHAATGASYFHGPAWARLWERYGDSPLELAPLRVELTDGAAAVIGSTSEPTRLPGLRRLVLSPESCAGGFCGEAPLDWEQRLAVARWLVDRRPLLWRVGAADADLHQVVSRGCRIESTHVVDLTEGAEAARKRFRSSARGSARRAASLGVTIRRATSQEDWAAYARVYLDTVRRWTTPLRVYDERLFELLAGEPQEGVRLFVAEHEGRICAGDLVLVHGTHSICWHGATDRDIAPPGTTNLLEWEVVGALAADGVLVYDMNGSGGLAGVVAFKESCGARPTRVLAHELRHPLERAARAVVGRIRPSGRARPDAAPTATVHRGDGALAGIDARWDGLVRAQLRPNPCQTAVWLTRLADWDDGEPLVVTVEEDGTLLAAGAFAVHRPAGRLGPSIARWLGPPAQWYAPDALVLPDRPEAGRSLARAVLGEVDGLSLPVVSGGPLSLALAGVAPWATRVGSGARGWVLPLPAARLATVRTAVGQEVRRAARAGVEVGVRVAREPDEIAPALEWHMALHRRRWEDDPAEEARYSATEGQRDWYRRAVLELAGLGCARIVEVCENGEPVGAELAFVVGGGAVAHTPAVPRGSTVRGLGHVLLLGLVEEMTAAGARVLDLGLGAGEPGGPKRRHDPLPETHDHLIVGANRRRQLALRAALGAREALARTRR
ncbi:MAG: GNAT family N-acetyltransferase [Thermoleophilia bacterium]